MPFALCIISRSPIYRHDSKNETLRTAVYFLSKLRDLVNMTIYMYIHCSIIINYILSLCDQTVLTEARTQQGSVSWTDNQTVC